MPRRKRNKTASSVSLGAYLLGLRQKTKLTLREVERQTKSEVSNAYLSQIENGYIEFPHPKILYALAKIYRANYQQLLRMCYTPPGEEEDHRVDHPELFTIDGLDREEFSACHAFLIYHRKVLRK